MNTLLIYGQYAVYTVIALMIMYALKQALNFKSKSILTADKELSNGNLAVALRRTGAQMAVGLAMLGVLSSPSQNEFAVDAALSIGYGFIAIGFILVTLLITDRILLPGICATTALKERNLSVGFVEFGMLTATGIIAYSSLYGGGDSIGGFISSLVYFAVGQMVLLSMIYFYEKIAQKRFKLLSEISSGHVSAGIYLAGKLVAFALILKLAIIGNGRVEEFNFASAAIDFITAAGVGFIFLWVSELILDKVIVTSSTIKEALEKDNIAPIIHLTVAKFALALILSAAIL